MVSAPLGTSSTKRCKDQARSRYNHQKQAGSPDDTCWHGCEAGRCRVSLCSLQGKWWVGDQGHWWNIYGWVSSFNHLTSPYLTLWVSSCSGQPVEVHWIWKCSRTPGGPRSSGRRERRDSVLRRRGLGHRGIQIRKTLVRALLCFISVAGDMGICWLTCIKLLSCLFQYQPHHRSCGGADAEPHGRDDGGAEGVRSPETRQYVWQFVQVNDSKITLLGPKQPFNHFREAKGAAGANKTS